MTEGEMLKELREVEGALADLLQDEDSWKGLDVSYHPPRVERLWRPWKKEFRVYLHRVHTCKPEEALFHPHPWPSAMRVVYGGYEMFVGFGSGDKEPSKMAKIILPESSAYEMSHPDAWHSVRPLGRTAMSIMVTGKPWNRWSPGSEEPLEELSKKQRRILFDFFFVRYTGEWQKRLLLSPTALLNRD